MYNKDTLILTEGSHFYMRLTMRDKLQMCEEHTLKEKELLRCVYKNTVELKYFILICIN